jgi:hypothetical protein
LRYDLAEYPEVFEANWSRFKDSSASADEPVKAVVRAVDAAGGIVSYVDASAQGLIADAQREAEQLAETLPRLTAGLDITGYLKHSGNCFFLAALLGAALGSGNAVAILGAAYVLYKEGCLG